MNWCSRLNGVEESTLISTMAAAISGSGIYALHLYVLKSLMQGRKELVNTQLELALLKEQLNPHFLLNAMNNLYGEALSFPDNVAERILNLSKLLRYQVETSKKDLVILSEEFNFIKQYLDYYKFRNERLIVTQSIFGNMEDIYLPPLLFMSLFENAVKFSSETDDPLIEFEMTVKDNSLCFMLRNNYIEKQALNSGTGVGLSNLKRRLKVYDYHYDFTYYAENDVFVVKLNLWGLCKSFEVINN
ncbi:sensor histidine kinase [Flavobacterium notoginsengisoli]